jgi:ferrochelatase
MKRTGFLLINLGTPDSTSVSDVRRFLREFLSDPRVLDLSALGRWMLLNLIILPFRPKKSAAAYEQIWTERGSPLLFHGLDLLEGVRPLLADLGPVEFAMRYQSPSLTAAMKALVDAGCTHIVALPLFPHYSSAAWGSAAEKLMAEASAGWNVPSLSFVPPFFAEPGYKQALETICTETLGEDDGAFHLFSFHGLPVRHCTKSDPTGAHCHVKPDCCDALVQANAYCYRAQCFETAHGLAKSLGLPRDRYDITFQSRLGRAEWIKPYTDLRVVELANKGVEHLVVHCPSFVSDCLETSEEIGIRAKEDFINAGGKTLRLVPAINSHPAWVQACADILRRASCAEEAPSSSLGTARA